MIVQLIGGLGNQLFQYAAGRAVAQRNQTDLKLDIRGFKTYALRAYRLGLYNVVEDFATPQEIYRLRPRRRHMIRRLQHRILRQFAPPYRQPVFRERSVYAVDPDLFKLQQDVYLIGYWQSEQYFADIADRVRREFTLKQAPDEPNRRMLDQIDRTNSVSLHVRRGDYATDPTTNRVHGTLSTTYYDDAIQYIAERVANPHFFIFSDDIPWVKENLRLTFPRTYIEHNGAEQDYEDLRLMSHCQHHIIANSSFSWWGAWLSSFAGKVVVAPRQWYAQTTVDVSSRYPSGWELL